MVNFFFTKYMANGDFSEPLDALIPKIPFSCFADFWVWVTFGGGGGSQGALSTLPPPQMKARPLQSCQRLQAVAEGRQWHPWLPARFRYGQFRVVESRFWPQRIAVVGPYRARAVKCQDVFPLYHLWRDNRSEPHFILRLVSALTVQRRNDAGVLVRAPVHRLSVSRSQIVGSI